MFWSFLWLQSGWIRVDGKLVQCFWYLLRSGCDALLLSHKADVEKYPAPEEAGSRVGSTCYGTGFLWLTLILEVKVSLGLKISFSLETLAFTVSQTQ